VEYYGRALQSLVKDVTIHCIHGKMKHKRNKIFAEFRAIKGSAQPLAVFPHTRGGSRVSPTGILTTLSLLEVVYSLCPVLIL